MTENKTIPRWFTITAIVTLIWNLLGVMAFIAQMMMTPESLAGLPQAEQDYYTSIPLWANAAFGLAVFGGALGCVALLLKNAIALPLFIVSIAAVAVQMLHAFFIANSFAVFGPGGLAMPVMVVGIGIALIWLANKAKNELWIK